MNSFVVFDIAVWCYLFFYFYHLVFTKWKLPLKWPKPCWNGCF